LSNVNNIEGNKQTLAL